MSPVDPEWETLDPNPDLHSLFVEFNTAFFWGRLVSCEVKWSPRMTTCAGEFLAKQKVWGQTFVHQAFVDIRLVRGTARLACQPPC